MDDDKKLPPGQDDSFDEHELDLNTSDDLEAIEDVTFADTSAESMAIFEEFDDLDDFDDFSQTPVNETVKETKMVKKEEDLGYRPENTDAGLLEQDPFDFKTDKPDETETFDTFDDVNSDFPEGDSSSTLGDSQLFDYDPSSATTEEELQADDIYAEAPQGGGGSGKGPGNEGRKTFLNKRRIIRLALLVVLAGAVYAGLRMFMGSGAGTMEITSASPVGAPPPIQASTTTTTSTTAESVPPTAPAPIVATPDVTAPPPVAATPEAAPTPDVTTSTSTTSTMVNNTPTPGVPTPVVTHTQVETAPANTITATTTSPGYTATTAAPANAMNQTPQTSFPVPGTGNTLTSTSTTTTTTVPGQDQITNKLNSLEASIHAIDSRLSHLSPTNKTTYVNAGMTSTESHSKSEDRVLMEALDKLNGIDRKMSHLSDLQTQIQILNKEVNALKSDVVQQSMIVGQNQAQINQNMASHIDQHAPKMYVQAAIPGRAWLRSETGQLITVIPGDEVAGYGRVVSIDATTGTVVMSSRAVFRE